MSAALGQTVARKVPVGMAVHEDARVARPVRPDEAARREHVASHQRREALLDQKAHVGAR